jgi:hypothetical protein
VAIDGRSGEAALGRDLSDGVATFHVLIGIPIHLAGKLGLSTTELHHQRFIEFGTSRQLPQYFVGEHIHSRRKQVIVSGFEVLVTIGNSSNADRRWSSIAETFIHRRRGLIESFG